MATENENRVDWRNGTWKDGDRVEFFESRPRSYLDVFPGLYFYSGLGSGNFFRPDHTIMGNCTPQEANAEARRLGVEMRYVDSFARAQTISVKD